MKDQQEYPTKKELLALLNNDRSYEPPPYFVRNPFNDRENFRSNYGHIEYLNPVAANKFFGTKRPNPPKFNLRERKKFLIERQDYLVRDLDEVFAFPASTLFFSRFSGLMMDMVNSHTGTKHHPSTNIGIQSKWYLTCISALLLKKYFGGKIVDRRCGKLGDKMHSNLTVQLEAVPYDIFIFNKIHSRDTYDFEEWIYSLFYCLWRYTNEGKSFNEPFFMEQLDYISQRI